MSLAGKPLGYSEHKWDWRNFAWVIVLLAAPNCVMYLAALLQGLERPLINVDYSIVLLCLVLGPRFIACLALSVVFFFDVLGLVGQVIPILRLSDVVYIASFISIAPISYQLMGVALAALLILFAVLYMNKKNKTMKAELLMMINLTVAAYLLSMFSFAPDTGQVWNRPAQPPLGSQIVFAFNSRNTGFVKSLYAEGDLFGDVPVKGATRPWFESSLNPSDKMLLVVNESWGVTSDDIHKAMLSPILEMESSLQDVESGTVEFRGLTVEAEIRELCQSDLMHFNFEKYKSELKGCLPNELKQKGYSTNAFHGAVGLMYDRVHWYPDIGFQTSMFFESVQWPRRCFSFPGACDSDIADYVSSSFKEDEKVFSYWLTLNSHYSYDSRDIHRGLLDCAAHGVQVRSEVCRNLSLQRQFFEDLARIIRKPEMAGVTVIVVGDHEPPITSVDEKEQYFKEGKVPWIRFVVPEANRLYAAKSIE